MAGMGHQHAHPVLEVTGQDPDEIQDNLTAAVNAVRKQALLTGDCGILIIQHGFGSFTVSLNASVPYGETHEQRQLETQPAPPPPEPGHQRNSPC